MKNLQIGKSGIEVPFLGMGTWAIGGGAWWGDNDDSLSVKAIQTAVEQGIRWIDTAPIYGLYHSEEVVGEAMKHIDRDKVVLSTKCGLEWRHETPVLHKVVDGVQTYEFGSSEGNLKEKLFLDKAGTPGTNDVIISFDFLFKSHQGQERGACTRAHQACDKFMQTYRDKMKKFKGDLCTHRSTYYDTVRPGAKRVVIIKQVAGQGAMYDTHLFGKEPSSSEGGKSIIDMGSKAFKDIPVQINTSVQLLTSLLRIATVKKSIRVISLNIFAISHNTSITTSHGIIRSYTRNRILHITTSGIAGIVVCNTIGITTISKFRPITIKTSTHFHIIEHIIVIIETSIITLKIVFHLNALFIHHTDRYVKIRLVVSTGC